MTIIRIAFIISTLSELFSIGNLIYKIILRSDMLYPIFMVVITTVVMLLCIALLRMFKAAMRNADDGEEPEEDIQNKPVNGS